MVNQCAGMNSLMKYGKIPTLCSTLGCLLAIHSLDFAGIGTWQRLHCSIDKAVFSEVDAASLTVSRVQFSAIPGLQFRVELCW
jgi:hypothetical protein